MEDNKRLKSWGVQIELTGENHIKDYRCKLCSYMFFRDENWFKNIVGFSIKGYIPGPLEDNGCWIVRCPNCHRCYWVHANNLYCDLDELKERGISWPPDEASQ